MQNLTFTICGKKLLHSLAVRAQMLCYLFPDAGGWRVGVRGVCDRPQWLWGCSCCVSFHDGGKRDPDDLPSCPHYPLKGLASQGGTIRKPGGDAAAQDALNNPSVERGKDGWWELGFPQVSQEAEMMLGFLCNGAGIEGPGKLKEFGVLDSQTGCWFCTSLLTFALPLWMLARRSYWWEPPLSI